MIFENALHINATPDQVWRITQDVEAWPDWNPIMHEVTRVDGGSFEVGSLVKIKQPSLPECKWCVTELEEGKRFVWKTRTLGITMIAAHSVIKAESGTNSLLRIEMKGLLTILLRPVVYLSVKKSLQRENDAIKAKCEAS